MVFTHIVYLSFVYLFLILEDLISNKTNHPEDCSSSKSLNIIKKKKSKNLKNDVSDGNVDELMIYHVY